MGCKQKCKRVMLKLLEKLSSCKGPLWGAFSFWQASSLHTLSKAGSKMREAREDIAVIFEMDNPEARIVGSDFEITIPSDMDKLEILNLIGKIIMIRKEKRPYE